MKSNLFTQANLEQEGARFHVQNKKILKVTLGEPIAAIKGSMIAYQGDVKFHHKGAGGVGKYLKQAATGEELPLMTVSGNGEVFFSNMGQDVFIVELEGEGLSVSSQYLLAWETTLTHDITRVKGAGVIGSSGGLFNTLLKGSGKVAISAGHQPLILQTDDPTFVDPDNAVCWSANLVPGIKSSMNVSSLLRGGTGEAFQFAFQGPGFVVVRS